MNGDPTMVDALLQAILMHYNVVNDAICVVFPPAVFLNQAQEIVRNSGIFLGAQNVYPQDGGAYTGEISAPMLKTLGCRYVLVGHSERRHWFHEDEKFVAEKFHHVKYHGMIPVLCVGETLAQRQRGETEAVLSQQLEAVFKEHPDAFKSSVVAYEPVWAIGTGKTALPEEAQAVHAYIRSFVASVDEQAAQDLPIIYGGSVQAGNARSLLMMPDVDGGLLGGASLQAQSFLEVLKCIN